jgi:hypothetical protein
MSIPAWDDVVGFLSTHSVVVATSITALVVGYSGRWMYQSWNCHQLATARVRYLKHLMKQSRLKLSQFEDQIQQLFQADWIPIQHEYSTQFASANTGVEIDKFIQRIRFLELNVQRVLESVDGIKPNGLLLEFCHRYPLGASTEDPLGESSHEELQTQVMKTFSKHHTKLNHQFDQLKLKRKALVKEVLCQLSKMDEMVDQLENYKLS